MSAYERLSAADQIFLALEDHNVHFHVTACFLFEAAPVKGSDGGVDFERICEYVQSRLHRTPRYRQRLETVPFTGDAIWVDDPSFNIQYHLRHTHLPHPGDERQLKRMCGRITSQQLDRGKPLWEMWVVEGLSDDRFAVITKVHHCLTDGVGGVELLGSLLSAKPVKEVDTGPTWVPRAAPEPSTLVRDAALQRLSAPFGLGRSLLQAGRDPRGSYEHAVDTVRGLAEAGALAARPASETPLNQPVGPHRRFDWLAIDLDAVKRVGKRLGGTVNDVALATAAGAIGRFLELRGITPAEQAELDFRVSCPVNTRTDRDRGRAGNRVSNLIAPLPIAERDPVERLARVRSTMRELKDSRQTLAFGVVESLSEQVAPGLLTLFARQNLENRSSNIVFTNVPGPPSRWHLLESQLQEVYPVVPLMPGQALGIALMSYSGGLYWGFNSDWELVPDLHELVVATHAAFEELCAAAEKAPARPRRSSKRRRSDASGASP